MITIIAAIGSNGELGAGNNMLWHLPEDFRIFKETTQGGTVIMGRNTWDSLPRKPLK